MTRLLILFFTAAIVLVSGCGPQKVTKAEYDAVREGMSYAEVAKIIGNPGEETVSNSLGGIKTEMYSWVNSDGSNMNAMFQDGELVTKAQFGLR